MAKPKDKPLTLKQARFAREYAIDGNGTRAARAAGYKGNGNTLHVVANENLRKPTVSAAVGQELALQHVDFSSHRVKRRLDQLSHGAEAAGQFGPAIRAEELIGKAAGMWIDLQLTGALSDEHIAALIASARTRQLQPVDNRDSDDDD